MNHDPSDIEGQEERRVAAEKEEAVRRAQDAADFRWLMRQIPFRRFAWRLMGRAGVFNQTYTPGDDGRLAAFNEGKREMGLWITGEIMEHCPEAYEQMLAERRAKREMTS